jgi:dihydroflavonol-4-reductase
MATAEPILVTGATGLIGSNVCKLLVEAGRPARALARVGSDVGPLERLGVELVAGDIVNADDVRAAAKGCAAVVNAAALLGGSDQNMEAQWATNHGGSMHCYVVAAASGIRVVELTTTTFFRHDEPLTESPVALSLEEAGDDPYTVTKGQAYRDGKQRADAGDDIVFVVPGGTFGPAPALERSLGPVGYNALLRAAIRGRVKEFISYPVPWVRAEDVARAVVAAVDRGVAGVTYLAFGREGARTTASFLNLGCELAGVDHRVAEVAAVLGDEVQLQKFGATQMALALRDWPEPWFDNRRTRDDLGYAPVGLGPAVAETIEWLRSNGKL